MTVSTFLECNFARVYPSGLKTVRFFLQATIFENFGNKNPFNCLISHPKLHQLLEDFVVMFGKLCRKI